MADAWPKEVESLVCDFNTREHQRKLKNVHKIKLEKIEKIDQKK